MFNFEFIPLFLNCQIYQDLASYYSGNDIRDPELLSRDPVSQGIVLFHSKVFMSLIVKLKLDFVPHFTILYILTYMCFIGMQSCNTCIEFSCPTSNCHAHIQQLPSFHKLTCRVRETFELNQLKSAPSQLLPVFSGFDRLQTCCH